AEVASSIRAQPTPLEKSAGCEIRPTNVTRTHVRSSYDDFAALIRRQLLAVLIDDEDLRPRHDVADGQKRILLQNRSLNADGSRGDGCLSGTVHVPNMRLWKAVKELTCGLRCE